MTMYDVFALAIFGALIFAGGYIVGIWAATPQRYRFDDSDEAGA